METLCFRLPGHGDSTLKHMDSLRSRQHFCDITIVSSDNQIFKGHKVVLAACSPYLRDQFLLNPSPKLQVSMLYSSSVVGDLLLSCYTGVLQFNSKEIVNYLTAASYLQMEHIVERCRGALKKYIQLNSLASLGASSGKVLMEKASGLFIIIKSNSSESLLQVNESDEEVTVKQEDSDVYKVYISEEERAHRDAVEKEAQSEIYISVELPQVDYSVGEADKQVAPLALEEAGGGEGVSGLEVQPSEGAGGGDESVAVVGSTSSNGPAPVICDYCGLAFPSANILALHCRTSHMLYACPCCGKKFHHSANLSRHMAVHRTGGKSHPCPLCCKSFTQKSTLIDHMNLHSGEKPHRCAYCHARFAHKPALRRHLKEQHGKTTGQNSLEQQERDRQESSGYAAIN
uniref:Uncharacterized protein n=1 Tax=Periophthalmus magnuspinnatus TaxID=409849 RepID=A0A3B4B645_9GOBI